MRAIIVDDEEPAILLMQHLLTQSNVEVLGTFTRVDDVLEQFPSLMPDVVFLDIEMPGTNGLTLASLLLEMHDQVDIVFVTAHDEYALQAFRVHAFDYLLKPVDPRQLSQTLTRLQGRRTWVSQRSSPSLIKVRCLGSFEITPPEGAETIHFPTQKSEELFAYFLVHHDRDESKWTICENLWPGRDPDKAEQNFHTSLHRLRRTLEMNQVQYRLTAKRGYYRLRLFDRCDYLEFLQMERQCISGMMNQTATLSVLERTLGLYRGVLFGNRDYLWCTPERERVHQIYQSLSNQVAKRLVDQGHLERARDLLQQVLTVIPEDEEAHQQLLGIYLAWQDRSAFLAHYQLMAQVLERELGVEPPATAVAMYKEMMRGAAPR